MYPVSVRAAIFRRPRPVPWWTHIQSAEFGTLGPDPRTLFLNAECLEKWLAFLNTVRTQHFEQIMALAMLEPFNPCTLNAS